MKGRRESSSVDAIVRPKTTRAKVQAKADEWRRQGFVGPTMASHAELAYTGIVDALAKLELQFTVRPSGEAVPAMR
jgi:fructose 1,6-bisphosphatase